MSPAQFHPNREIASRLKINKDSHFIKKSLPLSSSSSLSLTSSSLVMRAVKKPQQRHPVIIYTHSPKIIHTHPKDFMALVQKLTGLSRSEEDGGGSNIPVQPKQEPVRNVAAADKGHDHRKKIVGNEDNETSSVATDENNCSSSGSIGDSQVNSCFIAPPILSPYATSLPVFTPNSAEFLCSNQPFFNYTDSLFFSNNTSSYIPSAASLEGLNQFRDY